MRRFALFIVAVAIFVGLAAQACAQNRVALVIGNGAYANAVNLPNPPHDAEDMAAALRELDFQVITASNVDKVSFDQKVREFAGALRTARLALFYYAGHGMQVAGKNYAVPVDARLEGAADLSVETVDIDRVMSVMQADDNRVSLVFLDACRDNPLTRTFARALPMARSVSVGTGLTAVDAGRGTLIAFATAPNKVAFDGSGRNSLFTAALLKHIRTPGLDIAFVMRRVTADVEAASGGAQVPWVHASLTTDVVLKAGDGATAPPPAPVVASISPPPSLPERTAPNEPLPKDVPVDPDVLRLVETHPAFSNAPPVMASAYRVESSTQITGFSTSSSTTDTETVVQWLRPGLVKKDYMTDAESSSTGSSVRSKATTTSVLGGNGLFSLGYKHVGRSRLGTTVVILKALRIENISGRLFPIAIGNRFTYDIVNHSESTTSGSRSSSDWTMKYKCEVIKRYDAKSFHANLTGGAWLMSCDTQLILEKNRAAGSNSQTNTVFFDSLGLWISADPIFPREKIVSNGVVTTAETFTMTTTGSYTLKSFSLAR